MYNEQFLVIHQVIYLKPYVYIYILESNCGEIYNVQFFEQVQNFKHMGFQMKKIYYL